MDLYYLGIMLLFIPFKIHCFDTNPNRKIGGLSLKNSDCFNFKQHIENEAKLSINKMSFLNMVRYNFKLALCLDAGNFQNVYRARLKGGDRAYIRDHPYLAQLEITDHPDWIPQYCPGTIIGSTWIISSSYCDRDDVTKIIAIVASDSIFNGTKYDIKKTYTFHEFLLSKPPKGGFPTHPDYMLLELNRYLVYGFKVLPIQLGTKWDVVEGKLGTVVSFGHTEKDQEEHVFSQHPHAAQFTIMPLEKCKVVYPAVDEYTWEAFEYQTAFCVDSHGTEKATCNKDFGAPFVVNGRLVGISTKQVGCRNPTRDPAIFIDIPFARDWICSITKH